MFFVYAIKSNTRNSTYIGLTENLERRIKEHNSGKNRSTRAYRPFTLIYFEEQLTRPQARVREKYFKSGVGREFFRSI